MKGRGGWGTRRILLVVLALLVINVPWLLHEWQLHRAATDGVRVEATVVGLSRSGDHAIVEFRLPTSVDSSRQVRSAVIDPTSAASAARSREIGVRVLAGHSAVYRVDGQIRSWGATAITLTADLLVLVLIALSLRLGGRIRRPRLVARALDDVREGDDGSLLDKQDDGTYVINGEVSEADGSTLVVRLRDRDVTVRLEGYRNPVEVGGRALVRASLVG
ncbi:MAG: hypothetical protein WAV00_16500 [Nocardioides sp.]